MHRLVITLSLAFFASAAASAVARADTYVVNPDGTGDFPTIQAAIDAAEDGDIIELTDGTFTGVGNRDIDYLGKAITVRSHSGDPEVCIIDCQGSEAEPHRGFHFRRAEQDGSALMGVTITGGWPPSSPQGGAILCEAESCPNISSCIFSQNRGSAVLCLDGSSVTLTGCLFTQNEGNEAGALYCEACSPTVSDCDFVENTAEWYAGAFCGSASSATLSGCRFLHNTSPSSGAVTMYYGSEPVFRDCLFQSNWSGSHACGAMLLFCFVTGTIEDCTFVGNSTGNGGSTVGTGKMSHLHMTGCTFWGNSAPNGAIIGVGEIDGTIDNTVIAFSTEGQAAGGEHPITLSCCDLYGNAGGDWVGNIADQYGIRGNISEDPLFCDAENGDFTLQCTSPCAPFSPPNEECDLIGAWPVGCGGTPVSESTWGVIKALFRR
jgi:hypothetical protein